MPELPTGTVTFLFTDIEGSTRLLHELGDAYPEALAEHRRRLREAFARHGGVEVDTQGDAFFVAFARANDALAAARDGQKALADGAVRVRMGLHTGEPVVTNEGYVGIDVHRAARIAAAGHGGQVLLSQATRELVVADGLRDLGEHRLKDLSAPEQLYQLGEREFPPIKTLYQTNLPIQPTPLVGRKHELEEGRALLGEHRLLTLVGPGGTGKTRLALQLAAESTEDFEDGVWWVSLGATREADLVEVAIAHAVGARDGLHDYLHSKRALLLLDNFEQVLDAAPRLVELLGAAPGVKLLVTSRASLHVRGEQEYFVPPLPPNDAVALFVERASAVKPAFEAEEHVVEICVRLDGLPLALELAAARIRVLTPNKLLERLEQRLPLLTGGASDAPERHRTLRATIEWSYDLLSDEEQRLFARLAVFAGSFALEAAEEVCAADVDTLESLVEKSMLRDADGERFFFLETIREYAAERFESQEDHERINEEHAEHYAALAEEAEAQLEGSAQPLWLDRLEPENDNFRAALEWACQNGRTVVALRLVGALFRYWMVRGHLRQDVVWCERALALGGGDPQLRARALLGASYLGLRAGNVERAKRLAKEGLELYRRAGNKRGTAHALRDVANALTSTGEYEHALALTEESAALSREVGDQWNLAIALNNLGYNALCRGDYARAIEACEESFTLRRELGDHRGMALSRANASLALLAKGDVEEARAGLREALRVALEIGFHEGTIEALLGLSAISARRGNAVEAARALGAAEAIGEQHGVDPSWSPIEHRLYEQAIAEARQGLGESEFESERTRGRDMGLDGLD
jgi:predicted ATPase